MRNSSFIKIRKQRSTSIVWVALVLPLRQPDKCCGLRNMKCQIEVTPIEEKINTCINDSGLCFFIRNVRADPKYKERKRRVLQHDHHRRNCVYYRRDIMPKCVVDLERHWLPNLKNQPHKGSHVGIILHSFPFCFLILLRFFLSFSSLKKKLICNWNNYCSYWLIQTSTYADLIEQNHKFWMTKGRYNNQK